jgi:hypothetical protein
MTDDVFCWVTHALCIGDQLIASPKDCWLHSCVGAGAGASFAFLVGSSYSGVGGMPLITGDITFVPIKGTKNQLRSCIYGNFFTSRRVLVVVHCECWVTDGLPLTWCVTFWNRKITFRRLKNQQRNKEIWLRYITWTRTIACVLTTCHFGLKSVIFLIKHLNV